MKHARALFRPTDAVQFEGAWEAYGGPVNDSGPNRPHTGLKIAAAA